MKRKLTLKTLLFIFTFGCAISSVLVCLHIAVNILLYGYIRYSEPNLVGLWIEVIWIVSGLILLPYFSIDYIRLQEKKRMHSEIL